MFQPALIDLHVTDMCLGATDVGTVQNLIHALLYATDAEKLESWPAVTRMAQDYGDLLLAVEEGEYVPVEDLREAQGQAEDWEHEFRVADERDQEARRTAGTAAEVVSIARDRLDTLKVCLKPAKGSDTMAQVKDLAEFLADAEKLLRDLS